MEINRFEDVVGAVAQVNMTEGRFVLFTSNAHGGDVMNVDADLPGAKLPTTAEEAKRAKYCVTFAVENRPLPLVDYPQTAFDFRGGFVNAPAGPLTGLTMRLSYPGMQESQTIPSGHKVLCFTEGVFTIPSGQYIYNAALRTAGAAVMIADTASDGAAEAGKPKYQANVALGYVGVVQYFDEATAALTIRVRE